MKQLMRCSVTITNVSSTCASKQVFEKTGKGQAGCKQAGCAVLYGGVLCYAVLCCAVLHICMLLPPQYYTVNTVSSETALLSLMFIVGTANAGWCPE